MTHAPDIEDIRAGLAGNAEAIARDLLGEPNKALSSRRQLRWGSKGALKLDISGPRRGLWVDHSDGDQGGDLLALIRRELGVGFGEALSFARGRLGLPEPNGVARQERRQPRARAQRRGDEALKAAADAEEAKRIAVARRFWSERRPIDGTIAETYLVDVRKIPRPATGWPDVVAYHPGRRALIVAATNDAGDIQAVQFVYLTAQARKISAEDAGRRGLPERGKQTFGVVSGAAVRLQGEGAARRSG